LDWYVPEALDASFDNGHFEPDLPPLFFVFSSSNPSHDIYYLTLSLSKLQPFLKFSSDITCLLWFVESVDRQSHVLLSDDRDVDSSLQPIVRRFTLNEQQTLALCIVTESALGISKHGPKFLMGVFGEVGTGKNHMIHTIRALFADLNREHELVVTATTGIAAIKIGGSTVYLEYGDKSRLAFNIRPEKIRR